MASSTSSLVIAPNLRSTVPRHVHSHIRQGEISWLHFRIQEVALCAKSEQKRKLRATTTSMSYVTQAKRGEERNRLYSEDVPVHEWYRFVLSFPPHLVRDYLERFGIRPGQRVLDPFCGTGTTLVECKRAHIESVGIEANPVVHFAARVKTDWCIDPTDLVSHAKEIADEATAILEADGVPDAARLHSLDDVPTDYRTLTSDQMRLLIKGSISPRPLHKALVLRDVLDAHENDLCSNHERLVFAKHLVHSFSNLRFGPEVGAGKAKVDVPVVSKWLSGIRSMSRDLRRLEANSTTANVVRGDARDIERFLEPESIDAVITSPPYPNEKDYSRTTRLESVLLGYMTERSDLRAHKGELLRSNTRGVYKADRDDRWVADNSRVQELAHRIESKRVELGKTSGFEKLYHRVVLLYFGGMARHLAGLRHALRPDAQLAYVVGDQASFFRILIRTGELLAEIAEELGYEVVNRDLFRTRFSTATQEYIKEEVLLLRWRG